MLTPSRVVGDNVLVIKVETVKWIGSTVLS